MSDSDSRELPPSNGLAGRGGLSRILTHQDASILMNKSSLGKPMCTPPVVVTRADDPHRGAGRPVLIPMHPEPETMSTACGDSLAGCVTRPEQLATLQPAGARCRSFKYRDRIRVCSSETRITRLGFNAVKVDPGMPARTIRRNDGNIGMHGAME